MKIRFKRVLLVCLVLAALCGSLYFLGLYRPDTPEGGEFYFPYLYPFGPVVLYLSAWLTNLTRLLLEGAFPSLHFFAAFWIVFVCGIYASILGAIQWWLIFKLLTWPGRKRTKP